MEEEEEEEEGKTGSCLACVQVATMAFLIDNILKYYLIYLYFNIKLCIPQKLSHFLHSHNGFSNR